MEIILNGIESMNGNILTVVCTIVSVFVSIIVGSVVINKTTSVKNSKNKVKRNMTNVDGNNNEINNK